MGEAPTQVGSYRILGKLGEGGMGAVYEAVDETGLEHVAIKVLHPEYAKNEEFLGRFFNEARAVNTVNHPGLVRVSDSSTLPDGTAYIVMELLQGSSLGARLKSTSNGLPIAKVLRLGVMIGDALAAAHEKGIVHRDLKPENIMLVIDPAVPGEERTKLLDFGIAKLTDAQDFVKTRTNAMLGTPLYMSPEQCRGAGKVDDRADVYSFGVLLFAMTAGRPPFLGEGMGEIIGKHMYEPPPPLEALAPSVPAPLADLVARLLSKDRQQRPPMREVVATLRTMAENLPSLSAKSVDKDTGSLSSPSVSLPGGSTLGALAGQAQSTDADVRRHFWRKSGGLVALGLLGSVIIGAITLPSWTRSRSGAPTPAALNLANQDSVAQSASGTRSPRTVRWKIETLPSGAAVSWESDGKLLCKTPCLQERAPGPGQARLRIARDGFAGRLVVIPEDSDAQLSERLEPLRPAPPVPGKKPEKRTGAALNTPSAPRPAPSPAVSTPKPATHARPKIED